MPRWPKGKKHKRPWTDEERIADGQKRFELLDADGNVIDVVYRHHLWQANAIFAYHLKRMRKQEEERQEAMRQTENILANKKRELAEARRKKDLEEGIIDLNHMTFFDLPE